MDKCLETVAETQAAWSATANDLKQRYESARWQALVLAVGAALLSAIASQLEGSTRTYLAILSAVLLAIVSFLSARRLGPQHVIQWGRARVAAEALKREAYKYATLATPYDDPKTRLSTFHEQRKSIEDDVDDLLDLRVRGQSRSVPVDVISPAEYFKTRIRNQIDNYFEPKATLYKGISRTLRNIEFGLALMAACITAFVGVAGNDLMGIQFDFVALTAVLTTICGAILAHVDASKYDFLVVTYRATARRLQDMLLKAQDFNVPSVEWSAFVGQCEAILSDENNSWIAKFSKAA